MNAKILIAGLVAAGSLLAQPPGGPRGWGAREFGGPGGPGRGGQGRMQTVTGAPYSAVEVRTHQQVLAAGNTIQRQEQTNVYRDSQGRVRRETTMTEPDGQPHTRVTIADPVAGTITELDVKNKTAFTHPARFPSASATAGSSTTGTGGSASRTGVSEANVKHETLAAQSIHGIMASGTRVTRTIPAGTIGNSQALQTVRETWMSDDLKVPVKTSMTDPRMGTMTMELTNINRSQPDASLFQVPADYTVKQGMGGRGPGGRGPGPDRQ
jgi:uncharacterized protein DUF4412